MGSTIRNGLSSEWAASALCTLLLAAGCSEASNERQWSPEQALPSESPSSSPVLVATDDGRTLALWRAATPEGAVPRGVIDGLFASWKSPGADWGQPEVLDGFRSEYAKPSAAAGPDGAVTVVWVVPPDDVDPLEVWARRHEPGAAWREPELVAVVESPLLSWPRVAVGSDGRVMAVWAQGLPADGEVMLRKRMGDGWTTRDSFDLESLSASFLDFAVDDDGRAVLVWWSAGRTWVNRFDAESGWDLAEALAETDFYEVPSVDIDSEGTVWALWGGDSRDCAGAARNTAAGWGPLAHFDNLCLGNGGAIAGDGVGGAVAVWGVNYGTIEGPVDEVYWSRYRAGEGWLTPALTPHRTGFRPPYWALRVDAAGGAVATWYRSDFPDRGRTGNGIYEVWASRLTQEGSWTFAVQVSEFGPGAELASTTSPAALVTHPDGRAVAAWPSTRLEGSDITNRVWSAEFR